MKVSRVSFAQVHSSDTNPYLGRAARLTLGAALLVGFGTLIVRANDDVNVRGVMLQFSKPVREVVQTRVVQPIAQVPTQVRRYFGSAPQHPPQNRGFLTQPSTQSSLAPAPKFFPEVKPRETRVESADADLTKAAPRTERPRRAPLPGNGAGAGLSGATNYCVRLCDGFAFPVGWAGAGQERAHEAACQVACPGADTALYTSPAGAKDLDEATRQGRPYTALPTAFAYREKRVAGCACNAPGASQSSSALLTDFTLRRGDLVMSRIGMRHFDGAQSFPYRASNFADALARVKNPNEIRQIRALEAASIRGMNIAETPAPVRTRIAAEARRIENSAGPARIVELKPAGPGFQTITPPGRSVITVLPNSNRSGSFAALN